MAGAPLRPWLGVAVDAGVTAVLLLLGLDPVFDLVSGHRIEAATALGILHTVIVPWTLLGGLMKSDELGLFAWKKSHLTEILEGTFVLLYILGWMLPIFAFSVTPRVPKYLFYSCIFAHVAPIFAALGASLLGLSDRLDRLAAWLARKVGLLALLVGVYMAVAEVFFVLMRSHSSRVAPMAFVSWFLAYLPLRLFLARLTGFRGPEWGSLLLSMTLLLGRLLLTSPRR